jgi:hypothetical protein
MSVCAAVQTVVVSDLQSARRALVQAVASGATVRLVSPPDGVAQAGAAYWVALGREVGCEIIIDASGWPGYALEALRLGARSVVFRGDPGLRRRLDRLARRMGARVYGRLPAVARAAGRCAPPCGASAPAVARSHRAPSASSATAPECEERS